MREIARRFDLGVVGRTVSELEKDIKAKIGPPRPPPPIKKKVMTKADGPKAGLKTISKRYNAYTLFAEAHKQAKLMHPSLPTVSEMWNYVKNEDDDEGWASCAKMLNALAGPRISRSAMHGASTEACDILSNDQAWDLSDKEYGKFVERRIDYEKGLLRDAFIPPRFKTEQWLVARV